MIEQASSGRSSEASELSKFSAAATSDGTRTEAILPFCCTQFKCARGAGEHMQGIAEKKDGNSRVKGWPYVVQVGNAWPSHMGQ